MIYHFFVQFLPAPTRLFKFHEEKDVMYFVYFCTRVLRTVPDTQKFLLKDVELNYFIFPILFLLLLGGGSCYLFFLKIDPHPELER